MAFKYSGLDERLVLYHNAEPGLVETQWCSTVVHYLSGTRSVVVHSCEKSRFARRRVSHMKSRTRHTKRSANTRRMQRYHCAGSQRAIAMRAIRTRNLQSLCIHYKQIPTQPMPSKHHVITHSSHWPCDRISALKNDMQHSLFTPPSAPPRACIFRKCCATATPHVPKHTNIVRQIYLIE